MSELVTLSDQLTDEEWLDELAEIGEDRGYYESVGDRHGALFLDESLETLLVSFDTIASARAGSASGIPHGMLQAELNGWSHLSLIARDHSWFRDPAVYGYFDRLVDDAFFEDFDRVIFYGHGMCAYAAAAFSVAAPGATVIVVSPQATLDPEIASWDDRFMGMRRTNFTDRFGYAPDMLDAAQRAFIIYDPLEELDAMHAALFRGPQIEHIRFRFGGGRLGTDLQAMNAIGPILKAAGEDRLTRREIFRIFRRRRDYLPYLRNLLNRVHVDDRLWLTALLCRTVLSRKNAPRFRHHLELAEHKLTMQGRSLPEPHKKRSAAHKFPDLN
jgi:hypothetical protein